MLKKAFRVTVSLLMVLCLLLGLSANAIVLAVNEEKSLQQADMESQAVAGLNVAWNWLQDYAQANNSEIFSVFQQFAEYTESEEFAILSALLERMHQELNVETTPEQQERLAKETNELLQRLESIAAKATAKDCQVNYYVSMGDSTLTGYGLDKYVPGMNNGEGQVLGTEAPVLLAQMLFGDNYEEHFRKLDKGGLRVDDLLVWLGEDEFIDDFYIRYTMDENAVESETAYYQNLFISEIEKADMITLALGGGNVTTFVAQQMAALREGKEPYEMDWSKYFPEADMTVIRTCIAAVQKLLEGRLPEVKGVPAEKLAPMVAESFLFGYIGYLNNYPKVLERIHEINPDAQLVIVGYFNPIDEMEIPLEIEGETIEIPVGAMMGLLMESCNVRSLDYALENKENTIFVTVADATTILDEQGLFDLESQINGTITQTWLTHAGPNGHVYIAEQIYNAIQNEYTEEEITAEAAMVLVSYARYLVNELSAGEQADYVIGADSAFVALGNGTGYAGALGAYLTDIVNAAEYGYTYSVTDLTVAGSKIVDLAAVLEENRDIIAGADLVSLGYSNDELAEETLYTLFDALFYGTTPEAYDWEALLEQEMAAYIVEYLGQIKTSLDAQGMNVTLGEMIPFFASQFNSEVTISEAVVMAAEHFVYHTVAYIRYVPEVVADIHEMNADAQVAIVGLGNPFLGMCMTFGETTIDLGEMMSSLVELTDDLGLGYALVVDHVVFVSAPKVETNQTGTNIDTNDILGMLVMINSIMQKTFTLEITEQGNAYILEQLQNALNVTVAAPYQPEEPDEEEQPGEGEQPGGGEQPGEEEGLVGDVNGDNYVDVEDAMLVLQYDALLIEEDVLDLNAADVNGDGWVDVEDAMLILQYDALLIEKFPVEE